MEAHFSVEEQAKAEGLVSYLIQKSPAPTKIEITKSERGLVLTTFALITEDTVTKS